MNAAPSATGTAATIAQALRALLERRNTDAYVIFDHRPSGKFVQFTGSADEPLVLDLPFGALAPLERERAGRLFADLAALGLTLAPPAQPPVSFQLELDRSVERAAEITTAIFARVFGLPADLELSVEET